MLYTVFVIGGLCPRMLLVDEGNTRPRILGPAVVCNGGHVMPLPLDSEEPWQLCSGRWSRCIWT